jgi:hypothetical protein
MVTSHLTMMLPCAWWVATEFNSTYGEQMMDRLMAMTMVVAVTLSILYHLYNERVLCEAERTYLFGATALLNVYGAHDGGGLVCYLHTSRSARTPPLHTTKKVNACVVLMVQSSYRWCVLCVAVRLQIHGDERDILLVDSGGVASVRGVALCARHQPVKQGSVRRPAPPVPPHCR